MTPWLIARGSVERFRRKPNGKSPRGEPPPIAILGATRSRMMVSLILRRIGIEAGQHRSMRVRREGARWVAMPWPATCGSGVWMHGRKTRTFSGSNQTLKSAPRLTSALYEVGAGAAFQANFRALIATGSTASRLTSRSAFGCASQPTMHLLNHPLVSESGRRRSRSSTFLPAVDARPWHGICGKK